MTRGYQLLTPDDPNFVGYSEDDEEHFYRVLVDQSRNDIIADVELLKAAIENKDFSRAEFGGVTAVWFEHHLYEPLLNLTAGGDITIRPVVLNAGERRFVDDVRVFYNTKPDLLSGVDVYLLRNRGRGGGVGFFEAGNFHPDFMLWTSQDHRQGLAFIDPKGLLSVGSQDPKIRFSETIKEIETRLGDPDISLESFIVSTTPLALVRNRWGKSREWLNARHILFPQDDSDYLVRLFAPLVAAAIQAT